MKKFLITATLIFSMIILASMSLAVSAQTGPTAAMSIFPEPLRIGNLIYPYGHESTGDIVNYRFYCEDALGNEVTLLSVPDYLKQEIPVASYDVCCSGGTCDVGEAITISLEVTDSVGYTDTDSQTVTIWPAPLNTKDFTYNRLFPVPRTEVIMEVVPGSEILNNYNGKIILFDAVGGEDARVGATLAYPLDLVYPWADYAVAQSPFNPNLMAVITLDNMAVGGYMDGRAIFSADNLMYASATILMESVYTGVEERWLLAVGSDIRGGTYKGISSTVQSLRTCAFAGTSDPSVPFLVAIRPVEDLPLPGADPDQEPCNPTPIQHINSHAFRSEVKDGNKINHYW